MEAQTRNQAREEAPLNRDDDNALFRSRVGGEKKKRSRMAMKRSAGESAPRREVRRVRAKPKVVGKKGKGPHVPPKRKGSGKSRKKTKKKKFKKAKSAATLSDKLVIVSWSCVIETPRTKTHVFFS